MKRRRYGSGDRREAGGDDHLARRVEGNEARHYLAAWREREQVNLERTFGGYSVAGVLRHARGYRTIPLGDPLVMSRAMHRGYRLVSVMQAWVRRWFARREAQARRQATHLERSVTNYGSGRET